MKHIKLLSDLKIRVQVDNADYEMLSRYKWYALRTGGHIYAYTSRAELMHRIILGLKKGDGLKSDHINGDGLDNRRSNLRVCTHQENLRNRQKQCNATARYKGISKVNKRWRAQIKVGQKRIHLGYFDIDIEAAHAYNVAAKKYFGEFAYLNTF